APALRAGGGGNASPSRAASPPRFLHDPRGLHHAAGRHRPLPAEPGGSRARDHQGRDLEGAPASGAPGRRMRNLRFPFGVRTHGAEALARQGSRSPGAAVRAARAPMTPRTPPSLRLIKSPERAPATGAPEDASDRARIVSDLDRNVIIEAAAGTGKTTELVNRIVAVLGRGLTKVD